MQEKWIKVVGLAGAVNWTIPIAALSSLRDDPSTINSGLTSALIVYSGLFMRWSLAISPPNYVLFACHVTNEILQVVQLGRWFMNKSTSKSNFI
ncbi:probable mitochondrial pyruvate carrier 1 isoform X2 [Zophobas morio]|uniref:probable mitochondrial pyruvate carrier 1 isoform X2 n=1 Tax=Zophobas morio TaxID=2755281 RepID=UPI003082FDAB